MAITGKNRASAASRTRYTRDADARFKETAEKLGDLRAKIKLAAAKGSLDISEQLQRVEHQAETQLAAVERKLEQLQDADDGTWRDHKRALEDDWEALSRSITNIVARVL